MHAHGKRPTIRWLEFQHRYASKEEVQTWFKCWPASNVGIVTGKLSGLVVVDIDPQHGGDSSLTEFIKQHGPLPQSVEAVTGGGGAISIFPIPVVSFATRWDWYRGLICVVMVVV